MRDDEEAVLADNNCTEGDCPRISRTKDGMIRVQGISRSDIPTPEGEGIVDISPELLREAFRALGW
jgi:hypothetical protein